MPDTSAIVEAVQTRLHQLGYDPGPIDGEHGPATDAALVAFKAAHGLVARPAPLIVTLALLYSKEAQPAPKGAAPVTGKSPLLTIVRGMLGMQEAPGAANNPRIVELAQRAGVTWYREDATAWCAVFVNGALVEAGYPSTKSALARSFVTDKYGREIASRDIEPGDIIVFPRGTNPLYGHVEIVDAVNADGTVWAIGGNVSDRVKRTRRNISDILPHGIRRPVAA